jgi:hypothetical protein
MLFVEVLARRDQCTDDAAKCGARFSPGLARSTCDKPVPKATMRRSTTPSGDKPGVPRSRSMPVHGLCARCSQLVYHVRKSVAMVLVALFCFSPPRANVDAHLQVLSQRLHAIACATYCTVRNETVRHIKYDFASIVQSIMDEWRWTDTLDALQSATVARGAMSIRT